MTEILARNEYAKEDKEYKGYWKCGTRYSENRGYLLNEWGGDPEDYKTGTKLLLYIIILLSNISWINLP